MTKAFAYTRVSGRGQLTGGGLPRQTEVIRAYARAHDVKIVRTFEERGFSGTLESEDRPAWSELITELHADGVRVVVVEKLDRLARELLIQEKILAYLRKYGFTLISVAEPDLMASDASRILIRQIVGAIGEYDKRNIVARLRAGRIRKRQAVGRCEGRKPYGDRPGEEATLKRMKELHADMGFYRIAEKLNEEGRKSRSGKPWRGSSVSQILTRDSHKNREGQRVKS